MKEVQLSAAIMCHPRRAESAERIAALCGDLHPVVCPDPDPEAPGNLGAAVAAWSAANPGATHHLVLQDDVDLCRGFGDEVRRAVASKPEHPLYLFAEWGTRTGQMARLAALGGASWARASDPILCAQAIVMPTDMAAQFVDYAADHPELPPDDALVLRAFLGQLDRPAYISVPNLVEHQVMPSLLGNDVLMGCRKAVVFADDDPIKPQWNATTMDPVVPVPEFDAGKSYCSWYDGDQWQTMETSDWLAARGMPIRQQIAGFRTAEAAQTASKDSAILSPTLAFHLWLTAYLFGVVTRGRIDDMDQALSRPVACHAFATLLCGGTRALLSPETQMRLSTELLPLVESGLRDGAVADHVEVDW